RTPCQCLSISPASPALVQQLPPGLRQYHPPALCADRPPAFLRLLPSNKFKTTEGANTTEDGSVLCKDTTCLLSHAQGDDKVGCVVCLEQYSEGEVLRTLPCLHRFHAQCIDPWLSVQRRPTCPLCMTDVFDAVMKHERNLLALRTPAPIAEPPTAPGTVFASPILCAEFTLRAESSRLHALLS
ncbi:unnamed protein product, partial [Chrysoparadoxa australica]